ncbi:type 1 fimbrial protein [Escherichia coli]|uniref:fimbrial protein n=1 Tax=Escherichia coli TaxID=562 RepID=UPI001DE68689|nr:type 1 fimbrial protein [Escherichia coli]HAV8511575.1 type 1 fimbrial protein [Escherichia coli]
MSKLVITLVPVALALMVSANNSYAASNAQITISANVSASTCDVSLSSNTLDLGNWSPSAFGAQTAKPVAGSIKSFTVGLNNCDVPKAAADKANLIVTGQTLGGNPNMFNSTGTNTGIMLSQVATPTAYINNGDKINIATASTPPGVSDFNTKIVKLQAGVASSATTADIGEVKAPILFSFAYN